VDDQPVFVAAEIEDNSVVTYEIDGTGWKTTKAMVCNRD
jgi:hypothetical protein